VTGKPVFHNLTPGFEVSDSAGLPWCTLVDDVTIREGLNASEAAAPGWYRLVSDDPRLLRLAALYCDPAVPLHECLEPFARLFGVAVDVKSDGFVSVADSAGASLVIGAPLAGERERPCEVVTAPVQERHLERLEEVLEPSRDLGFTLPVEAAVHVHFDAAPFRNPRALRNLVRYVYPRQALLRSVLGTNERCRGLGSLPAALRDLVEDDRLVTGEWDRAQQLLAGLRLSKYSDLNLLNLVERPPGKDTIEWRQLPGAVNGEAVIAGVLICAGVMRLALESDCVPFTSAPLPVDQLTAGRLRYELGLLGAGE
jgi:hypothetical protein